MVSLMGKENYFRFKNIFRNLMVLWVMEVLSFGQTDLDMLDNLGMVKNMVMESWFGRIKVHIMVNGPIIK